jgi:hypothetical protein
MIGIITPIIATTIGIYTYSAQKTIYQTSLPFTVKIDNEGNSVNDLASLLGEKKKGLNEGDIMSLTSNWKFIRKVSEKIVEHPSFDKFTFSDALLNNYISTDVLLAGCKDKLECKIDRVSSILGNFFAMKKSIDENRYSIEIKSLSRDLNIQLASVLLEMVKQTRVEAIKSSITEKRKMSEELIDQKSQEFTDKKFDQLVDEKASLEQKLISMRNRLEDLGRSIIQNTMLVTSLESKIKHVKRTEKITISTGERDKFQRYNNLKDEIQRIRENITVLNSNVSSGKANQTDGYIILELHKNLDKKNKEIQLLEKDKMTRGIAGKDSFAEGQEKSELYLDLDFKVKKEEISKMQFEQKDLEKSIKVSTTRISELSNIISSLNPDREYLKLLESKVVSLKLVENTITSDLEFDSTNPIPSAFLRNSLAKVFMFSIVGSLFLIITLVVVLYLFDDKIYDENELALAFQELKVIGQTPKFDQF